MNTARSAIVVATLTDCSTTTIVVPSAASWATTSMRLATTVGARPSDSSSMMSSRGRHSIAWAIVSICCSPPDSDAGLLVEEPLEVREQLEDLAPSLVDELAVAVLGPLGDAQVVGDSQRAEDAAPAGHGDEPELARVGPGSVR